MILSHPASFVVLHFEVGAFCHLHEVEAGRSSCHEDPAAVREGAH